MYNFIRFYKKNNGRYVDNKRGLGLLINIFWLILFPPTTSNALKYYKWKFWNALYVYYMDRQFGDLLILPEKGTWK